MKLFIDPHTHTVASGHAYSTLTENAREAYKAGLQGIVVTDHGPDIRGSAPWFTISSVLAFIPEEVEGVRVFKGVEADIIDFEGGIDIRPSSLKLLDFVIASLHSDVIKSGGLEKNTNAVLGALNNPYVDAIGHPGNPAYPIDAEAVVAEAARLGKLIEINNHSFNARPGSEENCENILRLCKEHGTRVIVSSDAHVCYSVGRFDNAVSLIEKCGFPQELIVSADLSGFLEYVSNKKRV